MNINPRIGVFVFILLFALTPMSAQQVKMSALQVTRSEFTNKIKELRSANAKLTPAEFAEAANALMDKDGLPFTMSFDANTCQRLRSVKQQQKDPNAPLRLGATLKSVDAEGASLALPEPQFASTECGDCFVELPLLQVTDKDFITKLMGANIRFQLPSNFYTNEAVLFDTDQVTVKRKWRIPFRSVPIGVSHDENVLYLGFNEPELADLSLLIFGEGVFQIGTRVEAEEGGKGRSVDPAAATSNGLSKIKFERWSKTYVIGFRKPC